MCLIKGEELSPCTHDRCRYAYMKPKTGGIFKSHYIEARKDFDSYRRFQGISAIWIMAVNPYEPGTFERNNFECFRQARTEIKTEGEWPEGREIFSRDEVTFEFIEYDRIDFKFNFETNENDKVAVRDVHQIAVYAGEGGSHG